MESRSGSTGATAAVRFRRAAPVFGLGKHKLLGNRERAIFQGGAFAEPCCIEPGFALEAAGHERGEGGGGLFALEEKGVDLAEDRGLDAAGGAEFGEGRRGLVALDDGFAVIEQALDRGSFAEAETELAIATPAAVTGRARSPGGS